MTRESNWRPAVNSRDYLLNQQKKGAVADRRPVIRKASDLVGPGVGASATRITDFNDLLATFDGYYAADPGALDAPNNTDTFVGFVVMDSLLGGWQQFRSLETGVAYNRGFTRNPTDPATIYWGNWTSLDARVGTLETEVTGLSGDVTGLDSDLTDVTSRVVTLEGLERPLTFWDVLFSASALAVGQIGAFTVNFGFSYPVAPACWAVKSGFVTGSGSTVVSHVDNVTVSSARISMVNLGAAAATFTNCPFRLFAHQPN